VFQPNSAARASHTPGTIDLEISDPVLMLNEVARRYETTERVIMEYVDNALDDAEALYRENSNHYPYPISIELNIDLSTSQITIKDNCRGMPRQLLERVVKNIGESQKRGLTWVNGRFGFGVQAFRATAQSIQFQTKHATSSYHILELERDQHRGIKEAKRVDTPFPTDTGTGTIVTITGIDPAWADFSAESIKTEIESHFERLIARPNLTISVSNAGEAPLLCQPFDYQQVEGESIRQILQVTHKNETYPVELFLLAAGEKKVRHPVTFFVRGRRINEAVEIKSFIRKSKYKRGLWGHPNLLGYIEVGEIVQPAITRDDFDRTKGRQLCYEAILTLEPEIKAMIGRVNKSGKSKAFAGLETVAGDAINNIAASSPDTTDALKTGQPPLKFTNAPSNTPDTNQRASLTNGVIHINTDHPDFKSRMTYNRQGLPRISDRFLAYLAGIISIHLSEQTPPKETSDTSPQPDAEALLQAHISTMLKLEEQLHQQRAGLEKELAG
jgi:hypothetical protein